MAFKDLPVRPSSQIKSGRYDPDTKTLVLGLNGGNYSYGDVEPEKVVAMLESPSVGDFFHKVIRPFHPSKKI